MTLQEIMNHLWDSFDPEDPDREALIKDRVHFVRVVKILDKLDVI